MFASILLLFALPWLDSSKVRSLQFRPVAKFFFWLLFANVILLGYAGAQKPEGIWPVASALGTAFYFGYFLVILPLLSKFEKTLPLPTSISAAVLKKSA